MRLPSSLPWLALALAAALSTWASFALYQPLPTLSQRAQGADHLFIQPKARLFDLQGQPAYDIRGERLEHRAESDDYVLSQAEVTLYAKNTPSTPERQDEHWNIQAQQARILADREHIQLEGAVHAERLGVPPQDRITLQAHDVTLAHKAQTARSTQPVVVDGANWQSQSSAFSADLSTEQLEQQGRVHDRYQPQKP
jgi:LPS export ABC transporter protein LptC